MHMMEPERPSLDSYGRINLEGKNTGATFSLHGENGGQSHDCCCINIYLNNNIQGANNSVLHESELNMRNPGVCLFLGDVKLGKRSSLSRNKRRRKTKNEENTNTKLGSRARFLFGIFSVVLLLSLLII